MQAQRLLPLEPDDREQRHRLWMQIPERDRIEWLARCASLIARAARIAPSPQQQEERREANDR